MTTQVRASGVIIESDDVIIQPPTKAVQPRTRGAVDAGVTARREDAVLISALHAAGIELADAIPVGVGKSPVDAPVRMRAGPREPLRAVARLRVPLQVDEQAVVLLEEEGEYRWITASGVSEAAADVPRSRGTGGSGGSRLRHAEFDLELTSAAEKQSGTSRSRGFIGNKLIKGAIAYVLRFVVKAGSELLIRRLEKSVVEGLVQVEGVDPGAWKLVQSGDIRIPSSATRSPRLLLLVHGTFSSTAGGFGALAGTPEGQAFLTSALAHYDAVLGYDHRTLSVEPEHNAAAILTALRAIRWPAPPQVDIIAHSRGGLVTRELIERQLPTSDWEATIGPVVFVGCTNGGTQLANADQWQAFADHYTNLALGALRLGGLALAAGPWTVVARGAIQGVGILVKAIAVGALRQGGIPGLAAMQPDGAVVTRINSTNPGQVLAHDARWYAVTSNFEPDTALKLTPPSELPRKLLATLVTRFIDAATDSLYGEDNDLVVHVRAMTEVDAGSAQFFKDRLDFTANGTVYHTNYFAQARTAEQLSRWLRLDAPRAAATPSGRGRGGPGVRRANGVDSAQAVAAQAEAIAAAAEIDALLAQRSVSAALPAEEPTTSKVRAKRKSASVVKAKSRTKSSAKSKSRAASKSNTKPKAPRKAKAKPTTGATRTSRLKQSRTAKPKRERKPGAKATARRRR